jgi:hypothetical protein
MHNPRGSNDRNCERNVNRNNGNRLFDSQNNANGGYACPRAVGGIEVERTVPAVDATVIAANSIPTITSPTFGAMPLLMYEKMYYFPNSKLPIEWTAQHGCGGNQKLWCQSACPSVFGLFGVSPPLPGTPAPAPPPSSLSPHDSTCRLRPAPCAPCVRTLQS